VAPHVKRFFKIRRVRELAPAVTEAFALAQAGVPGPVAVLDLLPGRADAEVRRQAAQRRTSARRLGGAEYRSVTLAEVGGDWYPARERLVAAVRGFLLRHTEPPGAGAD